MVFMAMTAMERALAFPLWEVRARLCSRADFWLQRQRSSLPMYRVYSFPKTKIWSILCKSNHLHRFLRTLILTASLIAGVVGYLIIKAALGKANE